MLTRSEKQCLALTLAFLALGGGLKLWRRHQVVIGPVPTANAALAAPDTLAAIQPPVMAATPDAPVPAPASPRPKPPKPEAKIVALNRAGPNALASVPGIGPKTAEAIIAYRKAKGEFKDLRELLQVKGIGEKKLEKMRPFLVISPLADAEPDRQAAGPKLYN